MGQTIVLSILVALALSVDAFVACFAYGTNQKCSKTILKAPILIGAFHFIFPLITFYFFKSISVLNPIGDIISSLIFIALGLFCFLDKKETNKSALNIFGLILLTFSVSIDSLLIGVSLAFEVKSIILPAMIFGIVTATISYIAIKFGSYIACKIKYNLDSLAGLFFILFGLVNFTISVI
jgi:putative Mn2+ efflux pump MntP